MRRIKQKSLYIVHKIHEVKFVYINDFDMETTDLLVKH